MTDASVMWAAVVVVVVAAARGSEEGIRVTLDASCHPLEPCRLGYPPPLPGAAWDGINCFCDDHCKNYDDCCVDAPTRDVNSEQEPDPPALSCVDLTEYGGVYMVTTCPDVWDNEEVANLCLAATPTSNWNQSDILANLPVTSRDTYLTYANYYCAMCNSDSWALGVWGSRWECGVEVTSQNMTHEALASRVGFHGGTWGVEVAKGGAGESSFYPCSMYPSLPPSLEPHTRPCLTALLDTCASDWTDLDVRESCHSYTAVVYNFSTPIRNPHCALCNHLGPNDTTCRTFSVSPRTRGDGLFNPQAFAILFDFTDDGGGNTVGSTSPCGAQELWDPFFRRCRSLVCWQEDQVVVDGVCVDKGSNTPRNEPGTSTSTTTITAATTTTTKKPARKNIPIIFPDNPIFATTTPAATNSTPSPQQSTTTIQQPPPTTVPQPHTTTTTSQPPTTAPPQPPTTLLAIANTPPTPNETSQVPSCRPVLLMNDDYELYDDGTIYVANYNQNYTTEQYVVREEGVVVCPPVLQDAKFSQALGWLSLAGLGLSCACLLLHLIAFTLVPELRYLSGKNLACLSLTLVLAYVVFIANVVGGVEGEACVAMGAAMYYLFLAAVCWMNALALDVWLTFHRGKTELRVSTGSQWCRFIAYCVYSWGAPLLATAALLLLHHHPPPALPADFLPHLGENLCWIGRRKALFVFFAVPVVVMVVVNVVLFVMTARIIAETTLATASSTSAHHHRGQFKMYLRLAVLTGFTWLSGVVAAYLSLEALWYIFVLLNSLQGVFIFLAFTCRRKVWRSVASRSGVGRGRSWLVRRGEGSQGVELQDGPDLHSTPATSLDHY